MKLCFVIQRYGVDFVGGAEKYVESMATGLAADGHDISVITSCATSYEDWANVYPPGTTVDHGVTVHRVAVRAPRDNDRFIPLHLRAIQVHDTPLWPWAQDRWTQMMGPDLADVGPLVAAEAARCDATVLVGYHYSQTMRLTEIAAAHGATVVIPTAHPEGAFHVGRVGEMFQHADHVVCLAPEEADLVDDTYHCGDRISVVPCPVEPIESPSASAVEQARRAAGIADPRYGVVVGRVDPAKGSDDVVRFTRQLRRSTDPRFELVVIGPGGDGFAGIDGIISTGFVDESTKLELMAGAGVLIQPSYMESFSLALIEGWMLGRPALVQRRCHVLAGHVERSGGGASYDDYLSFEAALTAIRSRPDLATQLGDSGRAYALHDFAWSRISELFLRAMTVASTSGGRRLASGASV